jgi:glycogen(starch) synthase
MTNLLAAAGDTVHVIAHRWVGAPLVTEELAGGRLIVHRVALDQPVPSSWAATMVPEGSHVPRALLASSYPSQAFSWQAAVLGERLIEADDIDVIEAQEWEAPLYYLQVRRALGLGPARRPPCIVHLHSPTEFIFAANQWDTAVADYQPAAALEAYSIAAADAILCPSRYLAEQAVSRYQIDRARLHVIPYPLGEFPHIDRSADVWKSGSMSYVGRLEPRKGILEWVSAVAGVAGNRPSQVFEFVGGDTPLQSTGSVTIGESAQRKLPRTLRRQFHFHGSRDRAGIEDVLTRSCISVVPSRWENLPYSCIESMCSGLPMIVSPNGGMRELVEDGVSGWIATDGTPNGLAGALTRALEASGADRARMGAAAEDRVRRVCANDVVVRQHRELKTRLVQTSRAASSRAEAMFSAKGRERTLGVVISSPSGAWPLDACVSSIRAQGDPPAVVFVVGDHAGQEVAAGWHVSLESGQSAGAASLAAAIDMLSDSSLSGVVFVDGRVSVNAGLLAACRDVFDRNARLGIVSPWTRQTSPADGVRVPPLPEAPYLWQDGQFHPVVAVRRAVLHRMLCSECETTASAPVDAVSRGTDSVARDDDPRTALLDAAVRSGWAALTYPAVLGSFAMDFEKPGPRRPPVRYSAMAQAVQRLHVPLLTWLRTCAPADRIAFVRRGIRHPGRSARSLTGRALRGWRGRRKGPI